MRPEAGLSPDQTSGRFFGIEITRVSSLDRKKEKKTRVREVTAKELVDRASQMGRALLFGILLGGDRLRGDGLENVKKWWGELGQDGSPQSSQRAQRKKQNGAGWGLSRIRSIRVDWFWSVKLPSAASSSFFSVNSVVKYVPLIVFESLLTHPYSE
jgi:hypothetical protein